MKADFALMREASERLGGEVLNAMGDGLLLSFPSAESLSRSGSTMRTAVEPPAMTCRTCDGVSHERKRPRTWRDGQVARTV